MMTEREIKDWRAKEKERLNALHLTVPKELCRNTINVLTAVLEDD
jgi:hypothetical protein